MATAGFAAIVASTVPAFAATAVSVSSGSGLTNGQSITVTVTEVPALPSGVVVAITSCGNADSTGQALPGTQPAQTDCWGQEGLAAGAIAVAVPVNGTASGSVKVFNTDIGANHRKCIASPPANFPCYVAGADANIATQTGGAIFQVTKAITFAGAAASTTTTTQGTTTTTTSVTTTTTAAGGSTTTVAGATTTTSAGATTSTTASAVVTTTTRATVLNNAGGGSGTGINVTLNASSGSPNVGLPSSTNTDARVLGAQYTAPSSNRSLAHTGSGRTLLLLGGLAVIALDVGYLAESSTRPRRRRRGALAEGGGASD
jgi:hypothetical protein